MTGPSGRTRRKLVAAVALAAGSLACLELGARILEGVGRGATDGHGARRSLHGSPVSAGARPVVCAGDSLTFGAFLPEAASYPSRLRERLGARSRVAADVRNAGVSGDTSTLLLRRLQRDVLSLRPEAVVLWIGANDAMLVRDEFGREVPRPRPPSLLRRSALLRAISARGLLGPAAHHLDWPRGEPGALVPRVPVDEYARNLEALFAQLSGGGVARVVAVGFLRVPGHFRGAPPAVVARQRTVYLEYGEVLARSAASFGVPVVDVATVLAERDGGVFLEDGLHLAPAGYDAVAEAVLQVLALGVRPDGR